MNEIERDCQRLKEIVLPLIPHLRSLEKVEDEGVLDEGGRAATEADGFDQHRGPVPEPRPGGGDVGHQVGQREARDLGQSCRPGVAGQVGDVGAGEAQEGLTPVIMTL